ncbi:uncharacterized protein STEHIDRAFT_105911 [Stereum hirsutum FP-91666 SS1]|uniref:Uncharacterized protein n=1 Tax=Stereum hirsutum (strain FP-91666) TaxID=721885 RepID=R7RY49_STEHR|nr:uncharacterized protein STEHIDRAFT_105911 [Stereum hirsutum FP-91666 SS1]EIM80259.1 hypothetical protein STEHIDRAFT_105911 [Stereum hirsutum FP-91666 SS1]
MPTEPLSPPTVLDILANRDVFKALYPFHRPNTWRHSRTRPPSSSFLSRLITSRTPAKDTPAACFYRICTFFVLQWTTAFRRELEYFCCTHPDWSIAVLPDPFDSDSLRAAVLAVLTKLMCESFNRRIDLGLPRDAPAIIIDWDEIQSRPKKFEHPPEWATSTPPLSTRAVIPDDQGVSPNEADTNASSHFMEMNILAWTPHIHFT